MITRQFLAEEVRRTFVCFPKKFPDLTDEEVSIIQKEIRDSSFFFYKIWLVSYDKSDPIRKRFYSAFSFPELPEHCFSLFVQRREELVLTVLSELLDIIIKDYSPPLPLAGRSFAFRSDVDINVTTTTILVLLLVGKK